LLAAHEQPDTLLATQAEAARPTIKLDLTDAPDEAVGQTLGRYKLLERVGEGGCGVVYVAEQTEPVRRRVALQVIKLGMDTKQVVARFEAERQALAMMDHPNIAKVLDAGTTDVGRPYFVMELVLGIRITDYCDQGVLLYELLAGSTPFDAKELMASGIDAMRKTIREKEPARPSTKLSQTLVAADVRRLQSPSSDQPTTEEEDRADSRRLLRGKETIHQLKGDLDWIVMKCLEKDRQRRYESANGLATDLKRHLNNEPVLARPPTTAYKFQKAFRRNKLAHIAGTTVALALFFGFGLAMFAFLKERSSFRAMVAAARKNASALPSSAAMRIAPDRR